MNENLTKSLIFLDSEFTGLHQRTTLISIALYNSDECYFYAEFTDFDTTSLSPWLEEHVLSKLEFNITKTTLIQHGHSIKIKDNSTIIKKFLLKWLSQFNNIEIWADVLAYDWVLFCELLGGARSEEFPSNIFYAPFDLATLFRIKGYILPTDQYHRDINRFDFVDEDKALQHHALADARVEKLCYQKLMEI